MPRALPSAPRRLRPLALALGLGLAAAALAATTAIPQTTRGSRAGAPAAPGPAGRQAGGVAQPRQAPRQSMPSLLDRLPASALAGRAPALAPGAAAPANPEQIFEQFLAAYAQGRDRHTLDLALRLTQLAPNDVATELAVRTLSGQLENQGRDLIAAVPQLERALGQPLADPTTAYMLGRSLLAAVHAPGLALTQVHAMGLAGRITHWQLWGPFGPWQNLGFDQTFPIEQAAASSYPAQLAPGASAPDTITPHAFTNAGDGVSFPLDWGAQGVAFAVSYVNAPRPVRVLLRLYAEASAQVEVNGSTVIRNDRRSRYAPATAVAAIQLAAGWNRVVVKLTGEASRNFDLMFRNADGGDGFSSAARLPAGARLAAAPKLLPAPPTLGAWSDARLAQNPDDVVALWAGGLRLVQDEDAEHARVRLQHASTLDPKATLVWLDLAEAYAGLNDASQSWAASEIDTAAHKALALSPDAVRAYNRLGHVYESQAKPTQAAEQYAHCAGKGFSDCDWAQFHLAASQRWIPEAETALARALNESGSDWSSIASGLEFYSSVGDAAKLAQWERVLAADPRAAGNFAAYQLRHGHPARAAELFKTAIAFDPSSPELRRQYLDALLQNGQLDLAAAQASTALADFPANWRIAELADEIHMRRSPASGVAALRQTDFDRNVLRHRADYVADAKFWLPWYHSAAQILKDAPDKTEYPNASSILVFDQMVNRINPDSTQDQYIHQIYRVLNSVGISEYGTVTTIPQGSDLITIRTIKQDGRMLLPESIRNITDITMPGLEAGDYIEVEFVQHTAASNVIPGTMDNASSFIFNSTTQPYHYSDYIVLSPPHYPLLVDQERFPNNPTTTNLADGYTAREWLVQKTRILITEPNMPPYQNLVPKVWVGSEINWPEIRQYFADHMFSVRKTTPEMDAEAATITAGKSTPQDKADALYSWVADNIQPGDGSMLVPARQFFTDRNGNRDAVFLALLSAARVPYQLVLTRAVTDDSSTKIPSVYQFQLPLVHVGAEPPSAASDSPAGWYDFYGDYAHLNYINAAFRGGLAIVADPNPAASASPFIRVPAFSSTLDGIVVNVTGSVADSGDAAITLSLAFRGPSGEAVRNQLANVPDASLPQVYQQILLTNYPNATASGGSIENRTDKSKPLIITVHATVPDFVHTDGDAWDVERLAAPVGMLGRYAPLTARKEPLLITGDSYEQTRLSLTLPARFAHPDLPTPVKLQNNFGTFTSSITLQGSTLDFNRVLDLRANTIAPADYPAFRTFGQAVDQQDSLRITGSIPK